MLGELETLYKQFIVDDDSSILNIPSPGDCVYTPTHSHISSNTSTSSSDIILTQYCGRWLVSATPFSVGVDQPRGYED